MLLFFDLKIFLNLNKYCSVYLFIFVKENKFEKGRKFLLSDLCCDDDVCFFFGLLGLYLMNIIKFFKYVKVIEIIWIGVYCMFVV